MRPYTLYYASFNSLPSIAYKHKKLCLCVILLQDVNDNTPTFAQSSYILTVDQYTAAGTLVGTITPTDADSGANGDYSCSGSTTSASGSTYYSIGSDCGVYLLSSPSGRYQLFPINHTLCRLVYSPDNPTCGFYFTACELMYCWKKVRVGIVICLRSLFC